MRAGYPPVIVPTEQKDSYLAALRKADAGDLSALTNFLGNCSIAALNRGIRAAKGESIEEPDDLIMEIEVFKQQQKREGDSKEVDPKSKEAVHTIYDHSLKPLFSEYVEEHHRFDDLFHEVCIDSSFPGDTWEVALGNAVTRPLTDDIGGIGITYNLKGFKGESATPFDLKGEIFVQFQSFHYQATVMVGLFAKEWEAKLYAQPIPESERREMIRSSMDTLFQQIKAKSQGK